MPSPPRAGGWTRSDCGKSLTAARPSASTWIYRPSKPYRLQLALNADSEYAGGRLDFATAAAGLQIPARPAGSATIHGDDVAHGVTEMQNGVRHSLFLLHLRRPGGE